MPSTSLSMPSLKSFFHPLQSLNLQTFNEMGDSHPGMRNEGGELLQKSALFNPFDFTFLSGHSQFQSFWCWWFLSLWKILQWIFGWSSDFLTSSYSFRSVITHLLSFPLSKLYNCYCLSCFIFILFCIDFKAVCFHIETSSLWHCIMLGPEVSNEILMISKQRAVISFINILIFFLFFKTKIWGDA